MAELQTEKDIKSVINGLGPLTPIEGEDERWTLADRMSHYKIPGLSIAVIKEGRLAWARGFGYVEADTSVSVTNDTLFQACSMSKPFAALTIMKLFDRGALNLDQPVNEILKSWQLPESDFTNDTPVTLRHILSHTGGLSVSGFGGYERGKPLPTTRQVLDGEAPANSAPVRSKAAPGTLESYSGGGTTIAQLVLEEHFGRPFDEILEEQVLSPLNMTDSTFQQPLPDTLLDRAASGHDEHGRVIGGKWHVFPEMAAAGLWTTAADYGRFLMALQAAGQSVPNAILSSSALSEMMMRQPNSSYGIGPELTGSGKTVRFGHSGGNAGFRCDSKAYLEQGLGAVVLTNGNGHENGGWDLTQEVFSAIARVYDWPDFGRKPRRPIALSAADLQKYAGTYAILPIVDGHVLEIVVENGELVSRMAPMAPRRLYPVSDRDFFARSSQFDIRFTFGHEGSADLLEVIDGDKVVISAKRQA